MKVALVNTLYPPHAVGGAERVVQLLAETLTAEGHETVVITTTPARRAEVGSVNDVKVRYLPLQNLYWPYARSSEPSRAGKALWHSIDRYNPLMGRAFAAALAVERPDVVNTHNITGLSCAVWPQARALGIPIVHTIHDYSLLCPKASMFRNGRNCASRCWPCTVLTAPRKRHSALVECVAGVSGFALERHRASGYFARSSTSTVVHNGLRGDPRRPAREAFGARPLRLGFVGRLDPTKGIEQMLEALSRLDPSRWELSIAGRGAPPYQAQLAQRYQRSNVRFLGFVDPGSVYQQIDLLIVPSLWQEPMGMIVPEAYFNGAPVIAAARGGLPELVEDGRTGFLYDPDDPDGLVRVLQHILSDPDALARMAPHVLRKAKAFDVRSQARSYIELFESARRPRRS